jgi:SAM-dependent methyltransferase
MLDSIFDRTGDTDLRDYLKLCSAFQPIDIDEAQRLTLTAMRYYKGDLKLRDILVTGQELEKNWYASLEKGKPDYSVYGHDFFIGEIWTCWIIYSRKYLLALKSNKVLGNDKSIVEVISPKIATAVDLGCGFGYTTAGLKELFPAATVYGTNLPDTLQFKVATAIGVQRSFTIVPDISHIKTNIDLVFASEYFEHIQRPVEHLLKIIHHGKPRVFILANSFGSRSVGHFTNFLHGNATISNKLVGRLFNKTLRENGFKAVRTKLWNNRPSIWLR